MSSKLSLHCHRAGPDIDAAVRLANWAAVKALGTCDPLATARDHGVPIRILRQYGVEQLSPDQAAGRFLATAHLDAATHIQIVCESDKGYDLSWQAATMAALRAGGYTGRFLVGGFAVGNPPEISDTPQGGHLAQLEPIYPLLRRPDVDLCCDAYTGILATDPRWAQWAAYTVYRPTLIHADLARQGIDCDILVVESGGDDAKPEDNGRGGWRTRGWGQGDYLGTLRVVDADDQTHPWLRCRCVYTLGGTADWAAFEVAGILSALAQIVTQAATTPQRAQDAPHGPIAAPTAPAPVVPPLAPVATPAGPAGRNHALSIDNIPEMNQGPTSLCWAETTQEAFAGAGYSLSVYDLYKQVKGVDYVAPGLPATFGELTQCVLTAAKLTGATVKWFGAMGRVNDFATFDQLLRDGSWVVVVGANEQVLVNDLGLAENAGYGHYFICKHIDFNADGTPDTYTIDSYRAFDNVPVRIPLGAVHDAMRQNWDANYDALAYSLK